MIEIDAATDIDREPEAVFDYVAEPNNHEKFLPSLTEISDVSDADVGNEGRYVYSMLGQDLEGRFTDVTFDRPTTRSYELSGDIEGTVTWTFTERAGSTHIQYEQELDLPGPDLLEPVTDPVAKRFLQREAESMMENLEMLLEEPAVPAESSD